MGCCRGHVVDSPCSPFNYLTFDRILVTGCVNFERLKCIAPQAIKNEKSQSEERQNRRTMTVPSWYFACNYVTSN